MQVSSLSQHHTSMTEEDVKVMEKFLKDIYSDIASTRMDIGKLEA